MKTLRRVRLFSFLVLLFYFLFIKFCKPVLAYESFITHPALTTEIVNFYNASYNDKISNIEKQKIVQGSIDEDLPPRWLNHFFDPTTQDGWSAQNLGIIPQGVLQLFTKIFLNSTTQVVSSKNWVHNEALQAKYSDYGGNNTWENALRHYADGDTDTAYYMLGHVLHLLEDTTVPDHTRNDTHVHEASRITQDGGSPYEDYAKQLGSNLGLSFRLVKDNKVPIIFSSLDEYFDDLSKYSNSYFFSQNTILSKKYTNPKLIWEDDEGFGYGNDKHLQKFPIVKIFEFPDLKTGEVKKQYTLNDEKKLILSGYFTRLSEAAVLDGAGVIKLFKEQGDMVKKNPALLGPEPQPAALLPWEKAQSLLYGFLQPAANTISAATSKALISLHDGWNDLFGETAAPVQTQVSDKIISKPLANEDLVVNVIPSAAENRVEKVVKKVETKTVPPQAVLGEKIQNPVSNNQITQPIILPKISTNNKAQSSGGTSAALSAVQNDDRSMPDDSPTSTINGAASLVVPVTASATPEVFISSSTPSVGDTPTSTAATSTVQVADRVAPTVPVVRISYVVSEGQSFLRTAVSAVDDSGTVLYDISWSISTSTEKVWQDFVTSTTGSVFMLPVERGQRYFVRARSRDMSGNISDWSGESSIIIPFSQEVVINEIAWAGTSEANKNDQWIELYNTTETPIDLSRWKISISGRRIDIDFKNKNIPPHGYFLLERNTDDTVRQITADAIYYYAASFRAGGDQIDLIKDTDEVGDEVNALNGWFAGDSVEYRTMERVRPEVSGNDSNNWQSNQGDRGVGRTANGGVIQGSPRQSNFGFIMLTGRQSQTEVTLAKENNPYILGVYEVPVGKTLIIGPGVVIKSGLNAAALDISGSIILNGTPDQKVILTSGRDGSFADAALNTIVGNWAQSHPAAKDWQGVWVHPGGSAVLNNAVIRYAGHDFRVDNFIYRGFISEALRAENALLSIANSEFINSGAVDVYLYNSTSTIQNSVFAGAADSSISDVAIESENSALTLAHDTFKNFGNSTGPLWIKFVWPELDSLHFENNVLDALFLDRTSTRVDRVIDTFIPIVLNTAMVDKDTKLTIKPGVTIQLPTGGGLEVKGDLEAIGTPENPITFTAAPGSSYWNTIAFDRSVSHLAYTVLRQGNLLGQGVVQAKDSEVSIERSSVLDNRPPGLQLISLSNSRFNVSNSIFGYTEKPNFAELNGIVASGGSLDLDATIFKNFTYAIVANSNPLPELSVKNMNQDYFPGTPVPWTPIVWVGSDGKTITIDNSGISGN